MALHFDLTKITDSENICYTPIPDTDMVQMKGLTNTLIWATMSVGLREITETNIDEWMFRLSLMETCGFTLLVERNTETDERINRQPTEDELRSHIGLSTNADSLTRAQWLKRFTAYLVREEEYKIATKKRARIANA